MQLGSFIYMYVFNFTLKFAKKKKKIKPIVKYFFFISTPISKFKKNVADLAKDKNVFIFQIYKNTKSQQQPKAT